MINLGKSVRIASRGKYILKHKTSVSYSRKEISFFKLLPLIMNDKGLKLGDYSGL